MMRFFREKMKAIMITIAVIFAATMFYGLGYQGLGGGAGGRAKNDGLATVNGRQVDIFRFNQMVGRLAAQTKESRDPMVMIYLQNLALGQLIEFTLLQQAGEGGKGVGQAEIDKAVSDIMAANKIPDLKTFQKILKAQGFSLDDLKRMIKDEIIVQRFVSKINEDISITPDDLREVRAQHILIKPKDLSGGAWDEARKKIEDIRAQILSGKDFSALAKEYSQDPGSAKNGGDLGFFKKGRMVKEFENAVFSLKPGEVSMPVKTQYGWHLVKMNESRLIKNADREKLLAEKRENLFKQFVSERRSKSKIEIKNHLLSAFDKRMSNDLSGAAIEFKKAAEADPRSPYPHLFFADMLGQTGDSSAAVSEYEKASGLAGPDPYAHLYVGKAYLKASDTQKGSTAEAMESSGIAELEKASILAGDNIKIRQDLAVSFKELKLRKLLSEENSKIKKLQERKEMLDEIRKKSGMGTEEGR